MEEITYADNTREAMQRQEITRLKQSSPEAYLAGHNRGWNDGFKAGEKQGIEKGRAEVVNWRLEPCPHRAHNAKYFKPRCACEQCWENLFKSWGLEK